MHAPTVSVLMTSYNHEQYIGAAIESVLASTFADFELIVVDDCSLDQTAALAHQYARTDRRIHVVTNDKNLGDYPNRNQAASYATGTYLKYLDADDLLYPHSLVTHRIFVKKRLLDALRGEILLAVPQDMRHKERRAVVEL